ncbi:MAG: FAD-dependent oxidoreductase [Chloroflexi bacterium]|nr:FAD-dependent oxidoreductase [Chloroflexota bacterium]
MAVDDHQATRLVAVVGAGPAGLFAARELANEGVYVVLFNRDIKPGGLAEYGIYPDKHKMKEGLRAQFRQILDHPRIDYCGNVTIGQNGDFTLDELCQMGFQAVLVTAGAQGTKWLGLPGEDLSGVYHAKDLVYHYNRLPPFSEQEFAIGRLVAVVGVGNVMMDITHFLIDRKKVDEVIAVARRGPAEAKYDRKELETVAAHIDLAALQAEIDRCAPLMRSLGQDPAQPVALVQSALQKAERLNSPSRFTMQFLSSPTRILGDEHGKVVGLEVEDNTLVLNQNGETKARGLGTHRILDVDTVIFAIGDRVDEAFGLPLKGNEFYKDPEPRFPIEGNSYEVYDPKVGCRMETIFLAGWSRQASTGLVGIARKDGTNGAHAVHNYLQTLPAPEKIDLTPLRWRLEKLGKPVIKRSDLIRLEEIEQKRAKEVGLVEFKFASNKEMLEAIQADLEKAGD